MQSNRIKLFPAHSRLLFFITNKRSIAPGAHLGRYGSLPWGRLAVELLAGFLINQALASIPTVAFYYGNQPPASELHAFNWVVVQPSARIKPTRYDQTHSHLFAYVSVGEADPGSRTAKRLPKACVAGQDPIWKGKIINQALPRCRNFYLNDIIAPLWKQGYRGFFFDTLDSYRLIAHDQAAREAYRHGLIDLVRATKQRFPRAKLIFNRGFSILPALKGMVTAVAAESLYDGWDQSTQRYFKISPGERRALTKALAQVQAMGLPVIVIDYLPAAAREQARQDAARIEHDGYIPYITNAELDIVGVGTLDVLPRKILMLYSGTEDNIYTNLNWYAQMPLNYLGYATHIVNVQNVSLPRHPLTGEYAGIVTWFDSNHIPQATKVYRFLRTQIEAGVPVAILGNFGFPLDRAHLAPLGLALGTAPRDFLPAKPVRINRNLVGFETEPLPIPNDFLPLRLRRGRALAEISVGTSRGTEVAITPWGGYALDPFVVQGLPRGTLARNNRQAVWILDPFRFFRRALRLPIAPVPDTTSINGRRMLFAEIDGDGFASGSWIFRYHDWPAARVILDAVLKRFPTVPVAASVIASEFTDSGLYPNRKVAHIQPIARHIFRLPWVEIGTHTYSHPFDWPALEHNPNLSAGLHLNKDQDEHHTQHDIKIQGLEYGYNLPVPGYRFSPKMEITGSIDIINRLLAPPAKRVTIIQWSGDTDPDAAVLGIAYHDGVMNINGGNSTITRNSPSLTNVAPLGIWKGRYFQVFAPAANEDQFTHGWHPPYCGFARVIQTFEMTAKPRRLQPIDIYYHFYSGARPCALKQLEAVYRWAVKQPTTPVFPSTYARVVLGFEHVVLARKGKGYLVRGYGDDQELRIPAALGYPDLARSINVLGYTDYAGSRYIHLGPGGNAYLVLTSSPPKRPFLQSANARAVAFRRTPDGFDLTLRGHAPLRLELGNTSGCSLYRQDGTVVKGVRRLQAIAYRLKAHANRFRLRCR